MIHTSMQVSCSPGRNPYRYLFTLVALRLKRMVYIFQFGAFACWAQETTS